MQTWVKVLGVYIPTSFFEAEEHHHYNSLAMIDDQGAVMGVYRKSHIPDGPGYSEKFYFRPGNTGFKIWKTRYGTIGVGICWDQWYPETARAMMLMGAEILFYPTARSEEHTSELQSLMRTSYAVFCLKKKINTQIILSSNSLYLYPIVHLLQITYLFIYPIYTLIIFTA